MILSNVTIVIPSYNRHRQLARLLDYYSKIKVPVIVGDSTSYTFPYANKYKNVKYCHYPNLPYAHKLPLIYKHVKTNYVLFCADDDFVIPAAIKKSVEFLEKNPDYNSAHGHYIFFEEKKGEISAHPFYLYAVDMDINSPTPSGRLNQVLSSYMQLLYAVTRTKDVLDVFKYLAQNPQIKNDNLVELLQAIILCVNGKSKTLPILYCAREVTPNSARTHTAPLEVISTKPKFKKEYRIWVRAIVEELMKKEKISKNPAEKIVAEAIKSYLKDVLFVIPIINIPIYTQIIQRFIITATRGLAKKLRDSIIKPRDYKNLSKHAFFTALGEKEFEKIRDYMEKYAK